MWPLFRHRSGTVLAIVVNHLAGTGRTNRSTNLAEMAVARLLHARADQLHANIAATHRYIVAAGV